MSDAHNHRASDRVRVELIEADFDMAFSLIDDPRAEYQEGKREFAQLALSSLAPPSRRLVVSFFPTPSPIRKPHVRQRRT